MGRGVGHGAVLPAESPGMPDRREQGMIRYLTDGEKAESRDLWEEAFPEDSRSFDD